MALAKELDLTEPPIIIAASGSAGNACYFASHQYDEIERIWKQHLASWRFFFPLRIWRMMNIDYLVDVVFKQKEVFDIKTLCNTPTAIRIPLLNTHTHAVEFINPVNHPEVFEVLRASKAMPFIYGKRVLIGGIEYVDGAMVTPIDTMVHEAEKLAPTHIIIIDNRVRNRLYLKLKKWTGQFFGVQPLSNHLPQMKTLVIQDNESSAWFATTNPKKLATMFDAGYAKVKNNPELYNFITN